MAIFFQMVTEVGDDILKSGMMTYDDVQLVGGFIQDLLVSHDLYTHIASTVSIYQRYLNHPVPIPTTPSNRDVQPQMMTSSTKSINSSSSNADAVSKLGVSEASKVGGLPSSVIAVVVLAVLVFLSIIILIFTIPFCKKGDKLCFRKH